MVVVSSVVNALLNCSFKMLAWIFVSLYNSSSLPLRGDTPSLPLRVDTPSLPLRGDTPYLPLRGDLTNT
jgi:hypothetical protein